MAVNTITKLELNNKSVVVMPLQDWSKIESALEDLAMLTSKAYKKAVAKARGEKKLYSSNEVKKLLRL